MSYRARFAAAVARNAAVAAGVSTSMRYFVGDGLTQWNEHASQGEEEEGQRKWAVVQVTVAHESDMAPLKLPQPTLPPPPDAEQSKDEWLPSSASVSALSPLSWWQPLRSSVFSTFGLLYGIGPGYIWYNKILPRVFPGLALRAAFADVLLQCPLVYFPLFYVTNEAYQQRWAPTDLSRAPAVVRDALEQYSANFWEDQRALILFWLPCHFVNFRFVPLHFRMPFMACIGFGWSCILSSMRGNSMQRMQ